MAPSARLPTAFVMALISMDIPPAATPIPANAAPNANNPGDAAAAGPANAPRANDIPPKITASPTPPITRY